MTALDPQGRPVIIGRAVLRTPGLDGAVEVSAPESPGGLRASQDFTEALRQAVAESEVSPLETYRISKARVVAAAGAGTRSTATGEAAIELELPPPGVGWQQVVLATDEAGISTWHFPDESTVGSAASRDTQSAQRFLIRRYVPPSSAQGAASRGVAAAVGQKLLQVFAFKVIEKVGEKVAPIVAGRWEATKRPYRIRTFEPDNYRHGDAPLFTDWQKLTEGRALLLLHGTFSRAHSAFGGLTRDQIEQLHAHSSHRVIAFDHFTVSHTPQQNIEQLLSLIPPGITLNVDLLTHSRGGLVGRLLAEHSQNPINVCRSVFVAPPNAGTVLADADHLGVYLDRFTTLLNLFPDNGVLDVLSVIIDVVKHLATGAANSLTGLTAMRPGNPWLNALNHNVGSILPAPTYFVTGSNYEPTDPGLLAFVGDGAVDRIFGNAGNDLVVPSEGVHDLGQDGQLPSEGQLNLPATAGIHHSAYFSHPAVSTQILTWLTNDM